MIQRTVSIGAGPAMSLLASLLAGCDGNLPRALFVSGRRFGSKSAAVLLGALQHAAWRGGASSVPVADLAALKAAVESHASPPETWQDRRGGWRPDPMDECLADVARLGLPSPPTVVVRGREGYMAGGMALVPFGCGVLVGPPDWVVEALDGLDEAEFQVPPQS